MDVGRDIEVENGRANRAERWFTWSEISASVALLFIVAIVLALAAAFIVIDVIVGIIAG